MAKNSLFSWKRSDSVGSRSKKNNTDVQAWIKRMQVDSDMAAMDAYGDAIPGMNEVGAIQPDDQAIYEAQELLDRWIQDKHLSNLNLELEFKDEKWARSVQPLLNGDEGDTSSEFYSLSEDGRIISHKPFQPPGHDDPSISRTDLSDICDDVDVDYEEEANKMFQKFMSSTNVETAIMSDLGMDKTTKNFRDPRPKMEQRHQMVKERNRERKEKIKNVQREKMIKKDAEMMARKKVQEEEKSRRMKKQMEEGAIQRQMALIRKEMEEKKARAKDDEERKRRVAKEADEMIKLERRQKQIIKKEEEERRKIAEEKMRRGIMIEMEEKTMQEAAKNMRVLHKCFSAWYSVVVNHRVKVGKARAMSDWRCKLRAWNAWRAFINHIKSSKEAEEIAASMKVKYRKERMARNHFSVKLQRKCFVHWQWWVNKQQRDKDIKREKEINALRMASFLDAAANGRLWNNSSDKEASESAHPGGHQSKQSGRKEDAVEKVEAIFQAEERRVQPSPRHSNKKRRQLSFAFNRQEVLKEPANRIEDLDKTDAYVGASEMLDSRTERSEAQYDARKTVRGKKAGKFASDLVKLKQQMLRADGAKPLDSNFVQERTEQAHVNSLRLAESEAGYSMGNSLSERESSRSKEESSSRKASVKSDRPVTKPTILPMEERAKQRAEKKALMEEKRKRQEQQKLEQLRIEQEKLLVAEMEMKKEKLNKKREEERMQREREIEKKRKQEEYKALCNEADEHYRLSLIRRFGIKPWKDLVRISELNNHIAVTYHTRMLFTKALAAWKSYAEESNNEKQLRASECYRTILLRRSFSGWKMYGRHYDILEFMARKHFASVLLKRYWQFWQYFVTNERLAFWANEEKAEDHDEWRILNASFSKWKAFIVNAKEEKIREKRKEDLRKRVKELLPDFRV